MWFLFCLLLRQSITNQPPTPPDWLSYCIVPLHITNNNCNFSSPGTCFLRPDTMVTGLWLCPVRRICICEKALYHQRTSRMIITCPVAIPCHLPRDSTVTRTTSEWTGVVTWAHGSASEQTSRRPRSRKCENEWQLCEENHLLRIILILNVISTRWGLSFIFVIKLWRIRLLTINKRGI